jgi:hypothetical protein
LVLEEMEVCLATRRLGLVSVVPPAAAPWGRPGETPVRLAPLSIAVSMELRKGREQTLGSRNKLTFYPWAGVQRRYWRKNEKEINFSDYAETSQECFIEKEFEFLSSYCFQ